MRNINTLLLCVYWMNYGITGIRLLGCGSNGLSEVSEKSNFTLTCDGFDANDRVEWEVDNNKGNTFAAGTCPCCTCTDPLPSLPVSRTTATVSQLTVMSSRTWDNYNISCFINNISSEKKSCRIYAMYPADVTSCSVVVNNGSWTISGSCEISKVFTSSNIYKCMWYRGTSQMSQTTLITTTTYTPVIHSDPNYRQGTCTFTVAFDLPLVNGSYYYKVVVYPGGTEKQFGPLDIERPYEPTIMCTPSPYAQENININCNCKTTNVGKPDGYLTWSRESNGKINIINNGSYSGTSLSMNPQVLNASDHNSTVLQCSVVWMNTAIKGGFYIANVSFFHTENVSQYAPTSNTETLTFSDGIGVGIGLTITVALILIVLRAIYIWRQKRKMPCIDRTDGIPSNYLSPVLSVKQSDSETQNGISPEPHSTSYDALCGNEIGLSAPYSDLRLYEYVHDIRAGADYKVGKGGDISLVYGNAVV